MFLRVERHWLTIRRLALAHGVKRATMKKWRRRGVPWKWRLVLTEETNGAIPPEAFEPRKAG